MHLGGESGREEEGLAGDSGTLGKGIENLDELATEALVQETVGLVEDKGRQLREAGLHVGVLEQVNKTTRGGDKDIGTVTLSAIACSRHSHSFTNRPERRFLTSVAMLVPPTTHCTPMPAGRSFLAA